MAADRRVAVDTSVLVNYLTNGETDDASWLQHSTWVMQAAQRAQFRLAVPALAIAELAGEGTVRGDHLDRRVRHERVTRVQRWIRSATYVLVVDLDQRAARLAADIAIAHQLKGADASIVACALMARASTLYSWDKAHLGLNGLIEGIVIREPEAEATVQGDLLEDAAATSPPERTPPPEA